MRLLIEITPGDELRLQALTDHLNAVRLTEGQDPASTEEVASAILRRGVLDDYRAEIGTNPNTA